MRANIVLEHLNALLKDIPVPTIVDRLLLPVLTQDQVTGLLKGTIPLTKQAILLLSSCAVDVDAKAMKVTLSDEAKGHIDAIRVELGKLNMDDMVKDFTTKPFINPNSLN